MKLQIVQARGIEAKMQMHEAAVQRDILQRLVRFASGLEQELKKKLLSMFMAARPEHLYEPI